MSIEQRGNEPQDRGRHQPQAPDLRGSGVVQACLIAAGVQGTTLAALAANAINSGANTATIAVMVVMGVLIAGTLVVAAISVWRGGS